MKTIKLTSNPEVASHFKNYPDTVQDKMFALRQFVIEAAEELDEISELEETLKWGEPSYLTKIGSTIRMDWKSKKPGQYALYFKCTSRLVETFKEIYGDSFSYEGSRAIVFCINDRVPEDKLKVCIKAALTYHKVKHLPALGILK